MIDIKREIARLIQFAQSHQLLGEGDDISATNALIDLLKVDEPFEGELSADIPTSPTAILERILDYAAGNGLILDNNTTQRDLLDARIMGLLMPRQSEVTRDFWTKVKEQSPEQATASFYRMSIDSNYIRMDRIAKNDYWLSPTEYGDLEMTVNLSKPEKDPKEIAAERNAPQSRYPKCLLCLENVGYAGRINHPARQNHRVIPVQLEGKPWFIQYSPYVYYNEHCIVFSREHSPMRVSPSSFVRLLDFIDQFPHYFIGSNADLPIVGGSILGHDHFQGGRHQFPMEIAPVEHAFRSADYPGVSIGIVHWPMSVVRISGTDREQLIELAGSILQAWRAYSDPTVGILAFSDSPDGQVPHNTITPIARKNAQGEYEFDLVLRNNRTTKEHPLGIFHPHADLHHIKKENIGLIEVMGLAVLPGRLQQEISQIAEILVSSSRFISQETTMASDRQPDFSATANGDEALEKHLAWIKVLVDHYASSGELSEEAAITAVKHEIGIKFSRVLSDAGVYKQTDVGFHAFERFLTQFNA
ncbi:MAG: UDP-glucose--hexose-1-phosphate uridylyltransferase, partial [Gorillibacterium sp.]|nr:UDP-glucose--hexose-1-phosphate uridylyltransferase [Gorillibacterium sp.]